MRLGFHRGVNFGDALNPLIFDQLLPEYPSGPQDAVLLGIGSILGFDWGSGQKVVFSSGYAAGRPRTYGEPPVIDETFEIVCVRGPLTAEILGIDGGLAVTDGAALLARLPRPSVQKLYAYSYMPHVGSEDFFDWSVICDRVGFNYISPRLPVEEALGAIAASEVMIVEAMHGAIAADTLGVPWVSVRAYPTINQFKWRDWCRSMEVPYEPVELPSLFSVEYLNKALNIKFKSHLPEFVEHYGARIIQQYYHRTRHASLEEKMVALKGREPQLSSRPLLNSRVEQLSERLEYLRERYLYV